MSDSNDKDFVKDAKENLDKMVEQVEEAFSKTLKPKARKSRPQVAGFSKVTPGMIQEVTNQLAARIEELEEGLECLEEDVDIIDEILNEKALTVEPAPPKADLTKVAEADIRMQIFQRLLEALTEDCGIAGATTAVQKALEVSGLIPIPAAILEAHTLLTEQKLI